MSKSAGSAPLPSTLVAILLGGLEKAFGPSYAKILAQTPWARFLRQPPSKDPSVMESTAEEWARVCADIYRQAGKDLFITFGRYAGIESAKLFTSVLMKHLSNEVNSLDKLQRLQHIAAFHTAALNSQTTSMTLTNTDYGVLLVTKPCDVCVLINSNEPICSYITEGLRTAYSMMMGTRVSVQEIECQAMGKVDHCSFKVMML